LRYGCLFVRLFCVCVVLCVGSDLAMGWSPDQGVIPTVYRIKKLKKRPRSIKKNCRAIDSSVLRKFAVAALFYWHSLRSLVRSHDTWHTCGRARHVGPWESVCQSFMFKVCTEYDHHCYLACAWPHTANE
jgi:hypothetical protein